MNLHGGAQDHVLDMIPDSSIASTGLRKFIDRQITELDRGGAEARGAARAELRRMAWRAAIPYLRKEIRPGKNRYNAVGAILTLDGLGGEAVRPILRKVLFDDHYNRKERLAAALVLGKLPGKRTIQDLADAMCLTALGEEVKLGLALAAVRNPDRHLRAGLLRLAPRPVRPTRIWAAMVLALAEINAPNLNSWIVHLGRSGNPGIRRVACLAAIRLEDRTSLAMLADRFRLEKNDPWTAVCSTVAVGLRSPTWARSHLLKALRSSEDPVRQYAALALGWFPHQEATQALKLLFHKERRSEVREAVIRALERHRDASLLHKALEDTAPCVREAGMLLAVHLEKKRALNELDRRLVRETDTRVLETGLAVRLVVAGRHISANHPVRDGGAIVRMLRSSPWKDIDRYLDEPEAPAWRRARRLYRNQKNISNPLAVRARLLNASMLELLGLMGKFEMIERRIVVSRKTLPGRVVFPGRNRTSSELNREEEDLKIWLLNRPFFRE